MTLPTNPPSQTAKDLAKQLIDHGRDNCDHIYTDPNYDAAATLIQAALTAYGNSKLEEAVKEFGEKATDHCGYKIASQIRALKEKLSVEEFMEKQFADPETRAVYERLGES